MTRIGDRFGLSNARGARASDCTALPIPPELKHEIEKTQADKRNRRACEGHTRRLSSIDQRLLY
jgi:hypothetical protein